MKAPSYLIVGCGHFGERAVLELLQKNPHARITVVDRKETSLGKVSRLPVDARVSDGTSFVGQLLSGDRTADYIIPAVPFHLVFESILSQLKPLGARRIPVPSLLELPHPTKGKRGDLYTSFADYLCPDDCPEPAHACAVTAVRRPKPLFAILSELRGPFVSVVIRSWQLGPGVGGLKTAEWKDLINRIKERSRTGSLVLVSTACRCHGVISALTLPTISESLG